MTPATLTPPTDRTTDEGPDPIAVLVDVAEHLEALVEDYYTVTLTHTYRGVTVKTWVDAAHLAELVHRLRLTETTHTRVPTVGTVTTRTGQVNGVTVTVEAVTERDVAA